MIDPRVTVVDLKEPLGYYRRQILEGDAITKVGVVQVG
jgi:hypothetical protein